MLKIGVHTSLLCYIPTGSIPNTTGVDLRRKALFAASVAQFSFPLLLQLFSISWAKSRLDGSQEEQNGMETIWGEAGEGETL